nr:hypothetical protein [Tanacetum cinerariifolium]
MGDLNVRDIDVAGMVNEVSTNIHAGNVTGKDGTARRMTVVIDSISDSIAENFTLPGKAATVTGLKHNSTGVDTTIFGVSITSKEVLVGLVEKIKASDLDDVIYGLTIAEHEATHALILDSAIGFNYLNSDSDDTPSEEPNKNITTNAGLNSLVSKVTLIDNDTTPSMNTPLVSFMDVMNDTTIKVSNVDDDAFPSHESPIVKYAFPNSYTGEDGASSFESKNVKANYHSLVSKNLCDGVEY